MLNTTTAVTEPGCPYCSRDGVTIYHVGGCPRIRSVEYYPDGTIKRVEYAEAGRKALEE